MYINPYSKERNAGETSTMPALAKKTLDGTKRHEKHIPCSRQQKKQGKQMEASHPVPRGRISGAFPSHGATQK